MPTLTLILMNELLKTVQSSLGLRYFTALICAAERKRIKYQMNREHIFITVTLKQLHIELGSLGRGANGFAKHFIVQGKGGRGSNGRNLCTPQGWARQRE